uniref:C2H2-type domain-containing protein n=2 Tax=Caenorhabditis tropicalis TaxID=1561998 RepID=A0A1I7UNV0_9PELO
MHTMDRSKVVCGWKGCHNVYSNVEGMNVHVQADHMLYRVLLQTEFQGRTHLHGYDHDESSKQPVSQDIPTSGPIATGVPSTPSTPTHLTVPNRQPEISEQLLITEIHEEVQTSVPREPAKQVKYPPVPEGLQSSGPITLASIVAPNTKGISIQEEEETPEEEEEEEEMEVGSQEAPPRLSVATNGSPTGRTPTQHGRIDYSPVPPSSKKRGRKPSKYWVYTDQMTYRCSFGHCEAEFNNPESARHHYNSSHTLNDASESPLGPARKKGRGSGFRGRKITCTHTQCKRYFYSAEALERHLENLHGEEDVGDNLELDEINSVPQKPVVFKYEQEDVNDDSQQYEGGDGDIPEMKEIPQYI